MASKESMNIAEVIQMLEDGPWEERKKYLKDLRSEDGALINGFRFQDKIWCWIVWKPTSIEKEPQYKGEPLYKVVPEETVSARKGPGKGKLENITKILDLQYWLYL